MYAYEYNYMQFTLNLVLWAYVYEVYISTANKLKIQKESFSSPSEY